MASSTKTQQPPPPITTSSTAAEQGPPPPASPPHPLSRKQKGSNKSRHDNGRGPQRGSQSNDSQTTSEPAASDRVQRDPGVTDVIWQGLQGAKRKEEQRLKTARDAETALKKNMEEGKRQERSWQHERARNEAEREHLRKEYEIPGLNNQQPSKRKSRLKEN